MTKLDCVGGDGGKVGLETQTPQGQPHEETDLAKAMLDCSALRMLRSIQDSLGFSAAEDVILMWLEGCSLEGVERLAIALDDYLANRRQAEDQGDS